MVLTGAEITLPSFLMIPLSVSTNSFLTPIVSFHSVPLVLPLTISIGPPPLLLTPLVISVVFVSLSARTQTPLIRHCVQVLSLASTTHLLHLTSSIELSQVRGSIMAVTNTVGLKALIESCADIALLVFLLPAVCMTCQWRLDTSA